MTEPQNPTAEDGKASFGALLSVGSKPIIRMIALTLEATGSACICPVCDQLRKEASDLAKLMGLMSGIGGSE